LDFEERQGLTMRNNGGPAFPRPTGWNGLKSIDEHASNDAEVGMSLRDYFAAAAIQSPFFAQALVETPRDPAHTIGQHAALIAYTIAERMLVEREKKC
jgi:hypothetical protein